MIDKDLVKYNTNKDWKKFYDRLLSIDLQVDITNYNEIPAEVMMPANLAKNFLLEEGDNINDITEDLLYNRIGRSYNLNDISSLKVIPESILLEHSGSNIYVVSKQDIERLKAEGKKIIPSYKYKGEDSNSKYIIDKNTGESISKVNHPKKIRFEKSGYYFIGLVVLVILGFWPTYLSKYFDGTANFNFYFHFHALMASLWILLLIVQPVLIKKKKLKFK